MARTIKKNVKQDILKSVEELVAKIGVNSISLGDIAKKCDISKGTLYYYYSSKDDIIFDIIVKHVKELEEEYLEWIERHKEDLTPERFLGVIFNKGVKLFDRAKMHIFLINECIKGNDMLRDKFNELWFAWQKKLEVGVLQAFKDIEDAESFSYLLMLIIDGLAIQEVMQGKFIGDDKLIEVVKKIGEKQC